MQRTTLSAMILGLLLCCGSGILVASEADELRERAKALLKEATALTEQGKKEEAGQLKQEAEELLKSAKQSESKTKKRTEKKDQPNNEAVRQLKERLQDLREKERSLQESKVDDWKYKVAEVREQISAIEREFQKGNAPQGEQDKLRPEFREQAEKLEAATRRIHHLRVAAENLKMAEEHDLAQKLMEKAEAMERELQDAKQRFAAAMHEAHERQAGQMPDVVREMKEEIERLRAEVKELSQKVEKR